VSEDQDNGFPLFYEDNCEASCPEKCISMKWHIYNDNRKYFMDKKTINIDCGRLKQVKLFCVNLQNDIILQDVLQ
jgi:hypothetical protein